MAIGAPKLFAKPQTTPPPSTQAPSAAPAATTPTQAPIKVTMKNDCHGVNDVGEPLPAKSPPVCTTQVEDTSGNTTFVKIDNKGEITVTGKSPLSPEKQRKVAILNRAFGQMGQLLRGKSPDGKAGIADRLAHPLYLARIPGTKPEKYVPPYIPMVAALVNFHKEDPSRTIAPEINLHHKISDNKFSSAEGNQTLSYGTVIDGILQCAKEGQNSDSWMMTYAILSAGIDGSEDKLLAFKMTKDEIGALKKISQIVMDTAPEARLLAKFVQTVDLLMTDKRASDPQFVKWVSETLKYIMVVDSQDPDVSIKNLLDTIPEEKRADYKKALAKGLEAGFKISENTEGLYRKFGGVEARMESVFNLLQRKLSKKPTVVVQPQQQLNAGLTIGKKVAIGLGAAGLAAIAAGAIVFASSSPQQPPGTLKPTKGGTGPKTQELVISIRVPF